MPQDSKQDDQLLRYEECQRQAGAQLADSMVKYSSSSLESDMICKRSNVNPTNWRGSLWAWCRLEGVSGARVPERAELEYPRALKAE